jgi:hypothetical protein
MIKCKNCGELIILQSSDDEPRRISGEPYCKDCYFKSLGEAIEKHPIGAQFYKEYSVKKKTENVGQILLREDILKLGRLSTMKREEVLETIKKITADIKSGKISHWNWEKLK